MLVTFCGHSEVVQLDQVKCWLSEVVSQLIEEGAKTFYLGGYGGFDSLAATVVNEQEAAHPEIESVLVIPYLNMEWDHKRYDSTVYPDLEHVPPRFVVSRRNQWMVAEADVVVAYVTHSWGGAAKTLEYARRKKKNVILYPGLVTNSSQ
jgi:uncharacterized phage-like protein YoqJ